MGRRSVSWVVHEKVKCNCQGCTKRKLGCHDTCEDYKKFKASLAEVKKKERERNYYSSNNSWSYQHERSKND